MKARVTVEKKERLEETQQKKLTKEDKETTRRELR
jgi:hypothetical protein